MDNIDSTTLGLFVISLAALILGLVGLIFGVFIGGFRRNLRFVGGCWGRGLGLIYVLVGAPAVAVSGAVLWAQYNNQPNPEFVQSFALEGTFDPLTCLCGVIPALLLVTVMSVIVPDGSGANRRKHGKAGKRRMSDYPS